MFVLTFDNFPFRFQLLSVFQLMYRLTPKCVEHPYFWSQFNFRVLFTVILHNQLLRKAGKVELHSLRRGGTLPLLKVSSFACFAAEILPLITLLNQVVHDDSFSLTLYL